MIKQVAYIIISSFKGLKGFGSNLIHGQICFDLRRKSWKKRIEEKSKHLAWILFRNIKYYILETWVLKFCVFNVD
jgi:hypothetical protein